MDPAAAQKPALVLVHGAWHVPQIYAPFMKRLRDAKYDVFCPLLPTCDAAFRPASTLYRDVQTVREQLSQLVNQSRQVIMILHSYGGAVGTQAVKGLSASELSAQGRSGGVLHLVYMCGFMLQPGESVGGASLPRPVPEPVEADEAGTTFLCQPVVDLFFGDVEEHLASAAAKLLVRQSGSALSDTIDYPAWAHVPSTYLKCTEDQVLFLNWQERQIEAVRKTGTEIEVVTYDSSHSPFLSMPYEVIAVIERVTEKYSSS